MVGSRVGVPVDLCVKIMSTSLVGWKDLKMLVKG